MIFGLSRRIYSLGWVSVSSFSGLWRRAILGICRIDMNTENENRLGTPELIAGLNRLARNLWWTWNQEAQELFQELSPRSWRNLYHNAVAVLHEVSR